MILKQILIVGFREGMKENKNELKPLIHFQINNNAEAIVQKEHEDKICNLAEINTSISMLSLQTRNRQ